MDLAIATESTSPPCHGSTHQNPASPQIPVSVMPHPEMKQSVPMGKKKLGRHTVFTYFVSTAQCPSTGFNLSSAGEKINNNKKYFLQILIPNHHYQSVTQRCAKLCIPDVLFALHARPVPLVLLLPHRDFCLPITIHITKIQMGLNHNLA